MRGLRLWMAVGATALLASVAAVGAEAQTAPPPTLTGEQLASCGSGSLPGGGGVSCDGGDRGTLAIRVRCNDDGSGTISWTATGQATGPYNGTFTETGTVSFTGPGFVTNLQVTFHIDSVVPDADVDGRKFFVGPIGASGDCIEFSTAVFGNVGGVVRYEAIIKPSTGGSFADEGTSTLSALTIAEDEDVDTSIGAVRERFTSTLPATRQLLPDAKEQCKDEGFLIFGVFENQGDCVSFVSTHGKNEPGKNNG